MVLSMHRLMGLASRPQLPPLDVTSVITIIMHQKQCNCHSVYICTTVAKNGIPASPAGSCQGSPDVFCTLAVREWSAHTVGGRPEAIGGQPENGAGKRPRLPPESNSRPTIPHRNPECAGRASRVIGTFTGGCCGMTALEINSNIACQDQPLTNSLPKGLCSVS